MPYAGKDRVEHVLGDSLSATSLLFLVLALALALSFEFVNGFHDTANAVATVIYTNSLKPTYAVVWSGCWNLIGVLLSAGTVAFGILALLPVELVINVGSGAGFAKVFSLLISAIIWNVGTWYFGLPASSSHTLIGSIVGVGLANSVMSAGHTFGDGVNWGKVQDTLVALVVSPLIGFICSALLLLLFKFFVRKPELYEEPDKTKPPTPWVRALLILTCTGVSFAHGSNDGQKGMGLILLILIGVVPGAYALDLHMGGKDVATLLSQNQAASGVFHRLAGNDPVSAPEASDTLNAYLKNSGKVTPQLYPALEGKNGEIATALHGKTSIAQVPKDDRKGLRSDIYLVSASIAKLVKKKSISDADDAASLGAYHKTLDKTTNFIPTWVKFAVALCLGLGTMIGWKRIVVTVGERIGKAHLTYGQGASAEIVAYGTIQAADIFGLPVSTTHILSSGVAGTMAANRSGLQGATLRNILLAWVLTLPVCVFLGSMLFAFGLRLVSTFGIH
ncbi:MAG: inorganic phosphate transporter [Candidatus Eremiobacteraeota bacterium]|nr:inorganic phosphate transporter [Candidatus Eremiobacteraeota bacterium]